MYRSKGWTFFLSLFVVFVPCFAMTSCSDDPVDRDSVSTVLYSLPEDHRMHTQELYQDKRSMDWLYFTGTVSDVASGDLYGFEVNIFQVFPEGVDEFVYRTDIAISDVARQMFESKTIITLNAPELHFDPIARENVWEYDDDGVWISHREKSDIWEISVDNGEEGAKRMGINLLLTNETRGYYPETPNGIIEMGRCETGSITDMIGLSYYYSHPQLSTTGSFLLEGRTIPVQGFTWFDHQWGNFNDCPTNWDWFSLRFAEGSYMMLFNFNEPGDNGTSVPEKRAAAYFSSDNAIHYWKGPEAFQITPLRTYTSTVNGKRFRVDWLLTTPVGTFAVTPYFDEQVIDDPEDPYYEGIIEVREGSLQGPVVGNGYLETSFLTESIPN